MDAYKSFFILDASVILKWYLKENEPDLQQALEIQNDFFPKKTVRLGFPDYALAETMNIIGQKRPREETVAHFQEILNLNMEEFRITLEIVSYALKIMEKFPGVSFYDAGYHALALLEDGIFVTADERYYAKTHKQGNIMLLKDYGKKK